MNDTRTFPTDGIHNFRDYGGYASRFGGRVKRGLLYRSGQHVEASDADLALLRDLDIRTVIDLRGNTERVRNPCRRFEGWDGDVVFYDGETSSSPPHEAAAASDLTSDYAAHRMRSVYTRMPDNPAMRSIFGTYLRVLTERDGASLVHCFAGKDRTGMAVYLLHHILGVDPDDARLDYMQTNEMRTGHILERQSIPHLEERYGPLEDNTKRALLDVRLEYLERFLDQVAAQFASLDDYIANALNVDDTNIERLRARFLT